jgi:hypothetical protein
MVGLLLDWGGWPPVHEHASVALYLVLYVPSMTAKGVRFKSVETRIRIHTSGGTNEQSGG